MNSSENSAGMFAALGAIWLVLAIVFLAILIFHVWLYWRIFDKAGYNGALSLLMLIPFGQIIVPCILAFSTWPIEQHLVAGGGPMPGAPAPVIGGPPMTT